MSETCPSCGTDFPDGLAIMCKCWEGTAKQRAVLGLPAHKNRGNFANDPARAREAGRKGGRNHGKA
jgi:hypothetical protein